MTTQTTTQGRGQLVNSGLYLGLPHVAIPVLAAGDQLTAAGTTPMVDPSDQIEDGRSVVLSLREGAPPFLGFQLELEDDAAVTTPIEVVLFYRPDGNSIWDVVETQGQQLSASVQTATTDANNGTTRRTSIRASGAFWPVRGYGQYAIGIKTAATGTTLATGRGLLVPLH